MQKSNKGRFVISGKLDDFGTHFSVSGDEINFFGKEPSGSQIFQNGRQGQKVKSH